MSQCTLDSHINRLFLNTLCHVQSSLPNNRYSLFGASRQYYTFTKLWAFSAKLKHGDIDATVLGLNLVNK